MGPPEAGPAGAAAPPPADPAAFYRAMHARRGAGELEAVARVKRFRERLIADGAFRAALRSGTRGPAALVFGRFGVPDDPEAVRPLWDLELGHRVWNAPELAGWPDVLAWKGWNDDLARHRALGTAWPSRTCPDRRFVAWRDRQVRRAAAELGPAHAALNHPLVAYELSSGCTVGCWFCGVAAAGFRGAARFADDGPLWRGMLAAMVDLFGPAAATGFCYWATDPADNPDYPAFAEEHARVTGCLPQATTAAPLRDPAFTRRLLAQADAHRTAPTRFSITSLRQLLALFAEFPARELLGVELVPQMRGSLMPKAPAGRARGHPRAAAPAEEPGSAAAPIATIACVSGFLVNLPERTIRLISPCAASDRRPLGYRVHAVAGFRDAAGYRDQVARLVEDHMGETAPPGRKLGWREDLAVEILADRVLLADRRARHELRGRPCLVPLAASLARAPATAGELVAGLARDGHDVFAASAVLEDLVQAALVEPVIDADSPPSRAAPRRAAA